MQGSHLCCQKPRIRLQLLYIIRSVNTAACCCCSTACQYLLLRLLNSCIRLLSQAGCTACCQLLPGLQGPVGACICMARSAQPIPAAAATDLILKQLTHLHTHCKQRLAYPQSMQHA
jgi:hypothetical protein